LEQLIDSGQLGLSEYTLAIKNGWLCPLPPLYIPSTNREHTRDFLSSYWWLGIIAARVVARTICKPSVSHRFFFTGVGPFDVIVGYDPAGILSRNFASEYKRHGATKGSQP